MSVYVCHAIKYFNMTDFNGNLTLKVYVNKTLQVRLIITFLQKESKEHLHYQRTFSLTE